jgi:hypothetical protein
MGGRPELAPFTLPQSLLASSFSLASSWSALQQASEVEKAELFLLHVARDEPFRWSLLEGAKGLRLSDKGMESWCKRAWLGIRPYARAPKLMQ